MSAYHTILTMLAVVAEHLGEDLLAKTAFVGGCTTGLLITDALTREHLRATDDVDVIVEVLGYGEYVKLQQQLRERGFREVATEDVICRWQLGSIWVDVMPTNEQILGFSNCWYSAALATATLKHINDRQQIRVVTPVYFLATKIEAFAGRGKGNFLDSRDMEDIISLIDGYDSLCDEVADAPADVKQAIADAMQHYLCNTDFEYVVQSVAQDGRREKLLFARIEQLAGQNGR